MTRLRSRRARFAPLALLAAGLGSTVLGMSVTGTLSAFTASITNTTNTAASSSIVMRETGPNGQTLCLSSDGTSNANASCSSINKYGGTTTPLIPGGTPNVTNVLLANTGSATVNQFSLAAGACTKSGSTSGDLCSSLLLTLTCQAVAGGASRGTATPVFTARPLSTFAGQAIDLKNASTDCVPLAGAANDVRFTFSLQLDANATNDVQNQQVSQPLTWTFTGA